MAIDMPISHLSILIVCLLTLTSAANPLPANAPASQNPDPILLGSRATPTCYPVSLTTTQNTTTTNTTDDLSTFPSDCLSAMNSFLTIPIVSRNTYHWQRIPQHSIPPAGYGPLPFSVNQGSCVLVLDVLEDPWAQDMFALYQLKGELIALFRKCVGPFSRQQTSGFVAVGPRKVIGLTMKPKVEGDVVGIGGFEWNSTGWGGVA